MIETDYIIVGFGLAGICFTEQLEKNNKSYIVIDNNTNASTNIAAGLYNPVVLKRFTPIWKAEEQSNLAIPFYQSIEQKVKTKILFELPLYRKLYSIEEQNNWFEAADKHNLKQFLSTKLIENKNKSIEANYKFGQVNYTGYLDTSLLKSKYSEYLQNKIIKENFEYENLKIEPNFVSYKNLKSKYIVFCEGFQINQNPYFNNLPVNGTKGEILTIKAPLLNLTNIINSSIFILPLGNHLYRVGATYSWEDKTYNTTEEGKLELIENLKTLINCPFEIINHQAGIRPTVKDRNPLIGKHHTEKRLMVLNGLGTRGVLLAPYLSNALYQFIENNITIEPSIAVDRIYKKLFR